VGIFIEDYNVSGADTVALEDSIMQKGKQVTAGSKILDNFVSPFNATVVDRLLDGGFKISGRTVMDEFGLLKLSHDDNNTPSGAVRAVSEGISAYALCNDLFGRYREEAPQYDCCYIHPTYGTVSRYGLIPLASSLDQIGIVCRDLSQGFGLLSHLAGKDPKDGAMFPDSKYCYGKTDEKITLGIPRSVIEKADADTRESIMDFINKFSSTDIDLEYFDLYSQVMYILSSAEISNNLSRYDGIKFGYRASGYTDIDDLYTKTRSEGFGLDAKLTAIMGAVVLSKDHYGPYYEKAMKIRRLIKESINFDTYDVIVLPCKISDDPYENLALYSLAPLAGLPSVSFSYKGYGIQLVAGVKKENLLLSTWEVSMA
jgi:aspartyl-tRNA(Asn)/glutamyl-tRNA(Gln) amidotransferase subunit A